MLGQSGPPAFTTLLEAAAEQPYDPAEPTPALAMHNRTCESIINLLHANDFPAATTKEMEGLRKMLPGFINNGEELVTAEDPGAILSGQKVLIVMVGISIGLRIVPWSIIETLGQYGAGGYVDRRMMGRLIAALLRSPYLPVSDAEFQRAMDKLLFFIDSGTRLSRHEHPRIAMVGEKMLRIAWGMKIGLGQIESVTLFEEFLPRAPLSVILAADE